MKATLRDAHLSVALFVLGWTLTGCAAGRVGGPPPPPAVALGSSASTAGSEAKPHTQTPIQAPAPVPKPSAAPTAATAAGASKDDPDKNKDGVPDAAAKGSTSAPSTTSAGQDAKGAAPGAAGKDTPLGWIAGEPLEAEELLVEWGDIASRELLLVVDKLVAARLSLVEATRLGIKLEPEAVEQRYGAERKRLEEQVTKSGKKRTLEEFISRDLGLEPVRYLERVRRATIRQMLAERAVRAASLASETVSLRMIVVADEDKVKEVQAALAAGRDFADVAREFSVDESKENGGLVPFVVAQERSPLARIAFQTPVGQTAGPLPVADHQFLIQVVERRAPLEGDWSAVEKAVEESLVKYPVQDAEFMHWKLSMEARYPVDLTPLGNLIGAAK